MKTVENIEVGKWYKVKKTVFYCTEFNVNIRSRGAVHITARGIQPQHWAAYACQYYIGEGSEPYRTVAQLEGISEPPLVVVDFTSRAKIILLDKEYEFIK